MLPDELDELRGLCKNEESFGKLKKIVGSIAEERDRKARCLSLLELAISNDYNSILITEFDLEKPGPKIVYVNDGFCEMTGYPKEEVVGKTPRILQGPGTDQAVLEKLKARLKDGRCFFGQTVNYKKDGTEFVNQWDIHPLFDEKGEPAYWVSYQHDITERKRAEQQFVDTKMEFDELRERAYCTVVDVDTQGNIVSANQSFCKMLGYDKESLVGYKFWDIVPNRDRQTVRERFATLDDETKIEESEFKGLLKHKSGIPIQVKGEAQTLNLKDKKIIRSEIQNISLRKKVMEALQTKD